MMFLARRLAAHRLSGRPVSGRRLALCGLVLAALALPPLTAQARVDVPPDDPEPQSGGVSPLRLRPPGREEPVMPPPAIIILQNGYVMPQPFPGGCFNCPTLRPNSDNLSRLLTRSHAFSQNLYGQNVYGSGRPDTVLFFSK